MRVTFCGYPFDTAPGAVFSPRPATEHLVEAALERLGDEPVRVADVGTGAGVVAVTVALSRPHAEVVATDISAKASVVARANAVRHGVADRVHVVHTDLLAGVEGPFDLVLANLPYLPPGREVDFSGDPPKAIVSTGDGLDHYRRLAEQAGRLLAPRGRLLVQLHGRVGELTPEALAA